MAADDVADAVAHTALGQPVNGTVEYAGPEVFSLRELAQLDLRFHLDDREVEADPLGTYFGARLAPRDLLPSSTATIATTKYHDWRVHTPARTAPADREGAR
jgi:hypothetical protein